MKNYKFSIKCSCIICKQETTTQSLKNHYNKHLKQVEIKNCPKCGITHTNLGIFCSRKCANSRISKLETKQK